MRGFKHRLMEDRPWRLVRLAALCVLTGLIAGDIETRPTTVTPDESLLSAVNNLVKTGSNELVVVEGTDSRSIVGTLSRSDIMAAYNRQIVGPGSQRVLADG